MALPPLFDATAADVSGDIATMVGYTIIYGMMSRGALEKILKGPAPVIGGGGANAGGQSGRT